MTTSQTQHSSLNPTNKPVIGVLLVHGFNGNRNDMVELEAYLQVRGMLTVNMLLPGHGMSHARDLMLLGWADWAQAVRDELHKLKERWDVVFLVGHFMGGSLALHVGPHEEGTGVVVLS